ncbi:MAG: hypothetical protein K8L99_20250 [Anaerolineae bacterium]|nr:hypothetical protein [Anaerolineae bacterium]
MRSILTMVVLCSVFLIQFFTDMKPVLGQAQLECGSVIDGDILVDREIQEFQVPVSSGSRLFVHAEVTNGTLVIDTDIIAPNGTILGGEINWSARNELKQINSEELFQAGNYTVRVGGFTDLGGSYRLFVTCLDKEGTVTSQINSVQQGECGAIIENEFVRDDEIHRYYLSMMRGDVLNTAAEVVESNFPLRLDIGIFGKVGELNSLSFYSRSVENVAVTNGLPEDGIYSVLVQGYNQTGGPYRLYIGCTLADGSTISPGSGPSIQLKSGQVERAVPDSEIPETSDHVTEAVFSGTGFPGLAPVDFTNGVTIPFTAGAPNVGSLSPGFEGVFGFTLDANSGERYSFEFTRMSGNINLGIAILSPDNQVVFYGGMIAGDVLSTQVTFPTSGQYTIGVFQVDLLPPDAPEATTFQIMASPS